MTRDFRSRRGSAYHERLAHPGILGSRVHSRHAYTIFGMKSLPCMSRFLPKLITFLQNHT